MRQIICAFHCNSWWQNLHCVKEPQTGVWHGWHCASNKKRRCHAHEFLAKSSWKKRKLSFMGMQSLLWCCFLWCCQVSDSVGEQLSFYFFLNIVSEYFVPLSFLVGWQWLMQCHLWRLAESFISSPPPTPAGQQIPEGHNQWHRVCWGACHQWCPPVLFNCLIYSSVPWVRG